MATKPKEEAGQELRILAPRPRQVIIRIEGTSPFLSNRMDEKTLTALTNPTPTGKRGPKVFDDPETIWPQRLHEIDRDTGRFGVPGAAIHAALIAAGRHIDGVFMSELRGMFRIPFHLLEVEGSEPRKHFAMGRPQKTGPIMPIYRAEFPAPWEIAVPVMYDELLISLDSLVSLFARAGFSVGIGAWRPECSGTFGTFYVKDVAQVRQAA